MNGVLIKIILNLQQSGQQLKGGKWLNNKNFIKFSRLDSNIELKSLNDTYLNIKILKSMKYKYFEFLEYFEDVK